MASMKMVALGMVVIAALLQSSAAQTAHVVGDGLGWTVPPGGPVAYSSWASNQTFTVGDVLVFNYTTGQHDVAKVTKAAFDSCNSASPISIETSGPTNISLSTAGEHFFICTIGQHCNLGQKLAINVTGTSTSPSPSPSPSSPAPSPSPTSPPPSTATPPSPSAPTPNEPTAPSPSGTTTPPATPSPSGSNTPPSTPSPSGSATPSPSDTTAPPPPNGAPSSLAAAALPATLLSVALALLH